MWLWLVILVVAALAMGGLIALLLGRARSQAIEEEAAPPEQASSSVQPVKLPALIRELKPSFNASMERLRKVVRDVDFRYGVPWYVLLGPPDSGKSMLVEDAEAPTEGFSPTDYTQANSLAWHYFDGGVVIDVAGSLAFRGAGEDVSGWKALLELLRRHRPRRPIDGILLAVPAPLLLDENWKVRTHDLGAAIRERLVLAQSALGFSLPVYVIVTQTEVVPGFSAFAEALPDSLQQNMLGWSNPYDPETIFQGIWIDKAFEDIHRSLVHTQLELFAVNKHLERASAVFLFPGELHRLAVPLRMLLEETFRQSVYHAGFLFRGFYLTGQGPERALQAVGREVAAYKRRAVSFVSDLLDRKVFPERGLAAPLPRAAIARNRVSLTAQVVAAALAVVLAVGTTIAYARMLRVRAAHDVFLQDLEGELDRNLRLASNQSTTSNHQRILESYELLQGMVSVSRDVFPSLFVPISELSLVQSKAGRVFGEAFAHLILPDFRLGLEDRGKSLFGRMSDAALAEDEDLGRVSPVLEGSPRYRALEQFAAEYRRYVDNYFRYEALSHRHAGDMKDLAEVANYVTGRSNLLAVPLPEEPYGRALREATTAPVDCGSFDRLVDQRARRLLSDFGVSWFGDGNPVKASQARFVEHWNQLISDGDVEVREVAAELETLTQAVRTWASIGSRSGELRLTVLDLPPFRTLEAEVLCEALRPDLSEPIRRLAAMRDGLTTDLLAVDAEPFGPLLARNEKGLDLGDNLKALKAGFDDLRSKDFRTALPLGQDEAVLLPHARWRDEAMDHSLALLQSFDQYRSGAFSELDNGYRRPLLEALSWEVAQSLATRLSFDATEGPALPVESSALAAEITRLGAELDKMERLVAFLDETGVPFADALVKNLTRQATEALDRLEKDAAAHQPFIFGRQSEPLFTAWSDIQSEAPEPADRLKKWAVFADEQRETIRRYAALAAPLTRFLAASPGTAALSRRWGSIVDDVNGFERKITGNGLTLLDTFVRDGVPAMAADNDCSTAVASARGTGSFFVGVRNDLAGDAARRCRDLSRVGMQARYAAIAGAFGRVLAGRFPFAQSPVRTSDASLPDVVEVLRVYEEKDGRSLASQLQSRGCSEEGVRFLRRFEALSPLLTPLRGMPFPALSLDVQPEFRVNREREVGGHEIAGWQLDVGSQTFRDGDPPKPMLWASGDRVVLSLRFARDSPNRPVPAPGGRPSVDERTARFEFQGPWSLIALLAVGRFTPNDAAGVVDLTPTLVRFDVPVQRDPTQPPLAEASSAPVDRFRVYMRVRISARGKPDAVAIEEFPVTAPATVVCPANK